MYPLVFLLCVNWFMCLMCPNMCIVFFRLCANARMKLTEFVELFGSNKRQRLCHHCSDNAVELTCEVVGELTGPEISSED